MLLFNATFLNAQENRYYIKYEKQFFNTGKKGNCNSNMYSPLWLHVFVPGVSGSAWEYFNSSLAAQTYSLYRKPSSFRLFGRIGPSGTKENPVGPHDVSYTEGMSPFTLEISGSHTSSNWLKDCVRSLSAKYHITVDDPAVIASVAFESPHASVTYMCDNTVRVVVKVDPYYSNGNGSAVLQILDKNNAWQTLKTVAGNSTNYFTYSDVLKHVNLGSAIKFRTRKTLLDGSYSYSTSTSYLYYFPKFQFPAGKSLIVEPPVCAGGNTIVKIPYEGNVNYTLTTKGQEESSFGVNIEMKDCSTETIGGITYYKVSKQLTAGAHVLTLENKAGATPCPFETSFTIPEILEFTLSNRTFPDAVSTFQIRTRGGTGRVSFSVSGSRNQNITIHAGSQTFSKTLASSSVTSGVTYYSGSVSVDLKTGTYSIYATNTSCTSNTLSATLSEPAAISFTATSSSPDCSASSLPGGNAGNGSISLSGVSGGISGYSYAVNGGTPVSINANSASITGLPAQTYAVTVSDSYGNNASKNVTVSAPSPVTANLSPTAPSLSCTSDGKVTLNASGGASPYQYSRENRTSAFSGSNTVSGYSAGANTVYVKDAKGCVFSFPVTIPATLPLAVTSQSVVAPTCSGGSDGVCILAVENRRGALSVSGLPASCSTAASNSTITTSGLEAGSYSCTVIDAHNGSSCSLPVSFTIPPKQPVDVEASATPVGSKGSATGTITVGAAGGNGAPFAIALFDYASGAKLQEQSATSSCTFTGLTGSASGGGKLYRVTASDGNGCSRQMEVRVAEPAEQLQLRASITQLVSCHGGSDAWVSLSAQGGWGEYLYSRDNFSWTAQPDFSGFAAGSYTLYVKDKHNGSQQVSVTISEPAPLAIARDSILPVLCQGEATGLLRFRISGGTRPYSYTLHPATGAISETATGSGALVLAAGLPAGSYTLTVKDSRNCVATAAQEAIGEPAKLQLSAPIATHTTCELDNGAAKAVAAGGVAPYAYTLKSMDLSYSQTQMRALADTAFFGDLSPAAYRMTLTDNNGCSAQSLPLQINDYTNPAVKSVLPREAACFGENSGRADATPLPGTSPIQAFTMYGSSVGYTESNASGAFENLYAGAYLVEAYDENGCRSNSPYPVTISEPEALTIEVDTLLPVVAKGRKEGKIYFRVLGGNGGSKVARIKDANGNVLDSLSAIGSYQLSFTVHAGAYSLEATDAKGCLFATGLLQVEEPAESLRFIAREVKNALCKSQTGSIEVEGWGGWGEYRYRLDSGGYFSSLRRFDNLRPGSYLITVTDKLGASYSEIVAIYEPQDSLKAELVALAPPTCGSNGKASVRLSGGTPPYALYSAGDTLFCPKPQTLDWAGQGSGDLLLNLVDTNGCRSALKTFLPDTFRLSISGWEMVYPSASDASNGSIRATVGGGAEPYTYQWAATHTGIVDSANANASRLSNLPEGYYHLKVTDAVGCTVEDQVYLASREGLRFEALEIGHERAFKAANGHTVLYSEIKPIAYTLINPSQTLRSYSVTDANADFFVRNDTVFLQNQASGKWLMIARNAAGEQAVAEWEIKPYPEFTFTSTAVTPASCPGCSDGNIRVEVKGGGGEKRFAWANERGEALLSADEDRSSILANIPAGIYAVEVEDCYGNRLSRKLEISEPEDTLRIGIAWQQNQSCKAYRDAYVTLSASGGWGDYRFCHRDAEKSETGFSSAASYAGLATGVHWFYLTDRYGATDSVKVTVTEPEYVRASIVSIDSVKCKNASDGRIVFGITGGTAPYSFRRVEEDVWKNGREAGGLPSGEHTFIFTDSHSCEGQDTLIARVPEPDSLLFKSVAVTHTTCNENNGKISVELQGGIRGYRYRWLDFSQTEVGRDSVVSGLKQNALYRLEVADNNGCRQQLEQVIHPSTLPRVNRIEASDVLCYGDTTGSAQVVELTPAEPYSPYAIRWSNGDEGVFSHRFPKGQHYASIADTNRCATAFYFDIAQPDSLRLLFSEIKDPHCFGYSDGHILTKTLGGYGSYAYLWSNGTTTPDATGLTKGDYSVLVADENGCTCSRQASLSEPDYQLLDLGDDLLMCPGNTQVVDGQGYASHRWFTEAEGDISFERYLLVDRENRYFLEAKDERGCSAWGDIAVSIGSSALIADLLIASDAEVGDTLVIFELSNMELDSLKWEYDAAAFERVAAGDAHDLPYTLKLKCLSTGIYNVGLVAYSSGCYSPATKQIEVVEAKEKINADFRRNVEPLITSLKQYPNPSNGYFTIELKLREAAAARLLVFEVAKGICVDQRSVEGMEEYSIEYNLSYLPSGIYVIMAASGNERRQVKIAITAR
jgi:hypothetical protein